MNDAITVRYFAGAQAAAGLDQEDVAVTRPWQIQELVEHLAQRHGPALERVLAVSTFLVDEVAGSREHCVNGGSVVDVLPPFAGG